jgi:tetratricopeptide (TPR) repeat protein
MSPEQAERGVLDIDTRSDVYSLGVLLYELISGVQPIPSDVLRGAGYEQVQRLIRDIEPQRPSTRLSMLGGVDATVIATRRRTALPILIRDLRNELEWIPLRAMRKDREQRYRSAAELADDIRNHLEHRPLIAGPESGWYRARKMLRRHKAGVIATAAMLLLLIGGIVATTWQAVRATRAERLALRQKEQAERNREEADSVVQFLTQDVLGRATPEQLPDKSIRDAIVRVMLEPTANIVAERFAGRPLVEAQIENVLGVSYFALGQPDIGLTHARRALELHKAHLGNQHPYTLGSLDNVAANLCELGKFAEAESLCREALEGQRRLLGEDDPQTLSSLHQLALVLQAQGRFAEAEPLCRQALEGRRRLLGQNHLDTLETINLMSVLLKDLGRLGEAELLSREALNGLRQLLGEDSPATLSCKLQMARLLQDQGKLADAEVLCREVLESRRRVFGKDHPATLEPMVDLAGVLQVQGRLSEAEVFCREALEQCRRILGDEHRDVISYTNNLAVILLRQRKFADAEPLCRDAVDRSRRVWGDDQPNTISCINNLAFSLQRQSKLTQAEPLYREALERRRRVQGDAHRDTLATLANLGGMLADENRLTEAEPLLAELYRHAAASEAGPKFAALHLSYYGPCLARMGRYLEAEQPLREAYQRLTSTGLATDPRTVVVLGALADVCDHTNRPEEAAEWRAKLKDLQAATQPATNPG